MTKLQKAFAKLNRPPSAPNWVRYNHPDITKTAKAIANFVRSVPPLTFRPGIAAIKDRIEWHTDLNTGLKQVEKAARPQELKPNTDLLRAFYDYDRERSYSGNKRFDTYDEYFRISADISVPVTPTSVIIENGILVPIFVCGWSSLPFTDFHIRLLMTIYEDAIFSLTDFQKSPGEILFFPKDKPSGLRKPVVWKRGDYELLSESELSEQIEIFFAAKEQAKLIVENNIRKSPDYSEQEEGQPDREQELPILEYIAGSKQQN